MRLAIISPHVIQYFCPQYSSWSEIPGVDLKVFFGSKKGISEYYDDQFSRHVKWDGLSLNFPHTFLNNKETPEQYRSEELEECLNNFSPDAVLVYGWDKKLSRSATKWATFNKKSLILYSDAELRSQKNLMKTILKKLIIPRILKDFNIFLTVGDSNEEFYRNYGAMDRQFVRCSFPIDYFIFDKCLAERHTARATLRSKLGIPQHHKVILNVGKLVPWKRQIDLIDFSNSIQNHRNDITILLVGSGQDEGHLRARSKRLGAGGIVFAGFIQPPHLPQFYVASDLYAATSQRDRHSLAISEAIYAGLPIVISDQCGSVGPSDDVRPGVNGLVFPCGDVNAMTKLIFYVLDDAHVHDKLSKLSSAIAVERQATSHHAALAHVKILVRANNLGNDPTV